MVLAVVARTLQSLTGTRGIDPTMPTAGFDRSPWECCSLDGCRHLESVMQVPRRPNSSCLSAGRPKDEGLDSPQDRPRDGDTWRKYEQVLHSVPRRPNSSRLSAGRPKGRGVRLPAGSTTRWRYLACKYQLRVTSRAVTACKFQLRVTSRAVTACKCQFWNRTWEVARKDISVQAQ